MKRCERCILPESLPSVTLDENGLCSHCAQYDAQFGDWEGKAAQKESQFRDLVMQAKQLNRPYDCLVPLSGGKDSTYVLYVCSKVYGLRCLSVTFDNGFLTEHARRNIQNALDATGADHMFYSINRNHLLGLYRLFLEKSGEFCFVCMRGIAVATEKAASAFNVPLIVNGGGRRVAYLSMAPEVFQSGDHLVFRNVVDGEAAEWSSSPLSRPASVPGRMQGSGQSQTGVRGVAYKAVRLAGRVVDRSLRVIDPPVWPNPVTVGLFDYLDVEPAQVFQTLKQEMNWAAPTDQPEHMDCALHEIPFYIHTLKFPELTPHTFHRSGMVRRSLMDREEALRADEDEAAAPAAPQALDPFLEEIGMNEAEFESAVKDWKKLEQFR